MHWIPWSDILTTGHAEIDAEHKVMVKMFNQLADAVRNQQGENVCANILDDVIEFTISHFNHEAELMTQHRYPKTEQHNFEHVQLIKLARTFSEKFKSGPSGSHIQIIHFPEDWLTRHIVTWDRELGEFLANVDGGVAK